MTRAEDIERLMAQYAALRAQEENARDERVADARQRDARIGALLDENARLFSQAAREILVNRNDAARVAEALKTRVSQNQAEIARRLSALSLPPDALEVTRRCKACKDTGYAGDDRRAFCACFEARLSRMRGDAGEIPDEHAFERFDPAVYPDEAQRDRSRAALSVCEAYANELPVGKTLNLVLMGESGLGKTFLLDAVTRRAQEKDVPAARKTAFEALEAMRAYHFGENGQDNEFSRMLTVPLLALDDLGTEPMLKNITVEYLFTLLNERMAARRHTAIATNLTMSDLAQRYGERVLSRLMDRTKGEFIRLTGQDLRFRRA